MEEEFKYCIDESFRKKGDSEIADRFEDKYYRKDMCIYINKWVLITLDFYKPAHFRNFDKI